MKKEAIQELVNLANSLDKRGMKKEADAIDRVLKMIVANKLETGKCGDCGKTTELAADAIMSESPGGTETEGVCKKCAAEREGHGYRVRWIDPKTGHYTNQRVYTHDDVEDPLDEY